MSKKLDIEALLQGTEYEADAAFIAQKLSAAGIDNDYDIGNLPALGPVAGKNPHSLLSTILDQQAGVPGKPEVVPEPEPAEPEPFQPNASPAAVALAAERGVDLSEVEGTGKGGFIRKIDVEAVLVVSEE
jgi:pyruvate/2-oxoglutarate dehydrogenase complex dihydrolipoamide acyltransferase (E2) component